MRKTSDAEFTSRPIAPRFHLDDHDAICLVRLERLFAEALSQIDDGNDPPTQVDDALDIVGRVWNGRDFRDADDFPHHRNRQSEGFAPDPKADDLEFLVHDGFVSFQERTISAYSARLVAFRGRTAPAGLPVVGMRLFQSEAIHRIEQVARELGHLLGGRSEFGGTGCGLLHELAHPLHRANDGLRARGLLFDRGIDFLSDFGEAVGGLGDLSGAAGLLHGGGANFL